MRINRAIGSTALAVCLLAAARLSLAHQDTLIKIGLLDGRLEGLPPAHQPAYLKLPLADDGRVVLQLKGRRLELPECLSVLFTKSSRADMVLSASWYHDPKILPPYLLIRLPVRPPLGRGDGYGYDYDGWHIMLDINRVRVLRVEAVFTIGRDRGLRSQAIDIDKFCGGRTPLDAPRVPR